MTVRRGLPAALAGLVLAGALLLLAAGRVWGRATVTTATGARVHAEVTGHAVAGTLASCGGALLALALVALVVRGRARRLTGAVAALVGAGAAVAAVAGQHDVGSALAGKAFAAQVTSVAAPVTVWPWLAAAAGVLAASCGLALFLLGHRWSGLGRRYDAPGATESAVDDDDAAQWAALDRGDDPTA
jgi:uncharacterized membrane protein (TIGR02234 family)